MARRSIPDEMQKDILTQSRRRCCICFGLNRDTSLTQGQIAHLDHNPNNNNEDNLAFLCLNHHDQYDSKTRQSKNFTIREVKHYRLELIEFLKSELNRELPLDDASRKDDTIEGLYIRVGITDSAELKISRIAGSTNIYHVSGFALWGTSRVYGPTTGDIEFSSYLNGKCIVYISNRTFIYGSPPTGRRHRMTLFFSEDNLTVIEEDWAYIYGMNVNFNGDYRKVS